MKLTKELVEGFLERYDGDLSEPILEIAGSGDPVGSLLEYLNRKDIIEWLLYEFDGLLMHGFQQPRILSFPKEKIASSCSHFLRQPRPRTPAVWSVTSSRLVILRALYSRKVHSRI